MNAAVEENRITVKVEENRITANCERHGQFVAQVFAIAGRRIESKCPVCERERDAEASARKKSDDFARRREAITKMTGASGIPPRFQSRTLDGYVAETNGQKMARRIATQYADSFADRLANGGGLVFCGSPGTGKTHLATAIANQILATGHPALFMTVIRAVRAVKETYRKDSTVTESQALAGFLVPDLLILDEVGVQFGTDAEKMILFEIINGRYENVKPTILLSNLSEAALGDFIGTRVVDRMREGGGAIVTFDWDSFRGRV